MDNSLLASLASSSRPAAATVPYNQMSPEQQEIIKDRNRRIAERLRQGGDSVSVSQIAKEFNVSTQCVYDVRRTHIRNGKRVTTINGHRVRAGGQDLIAQAEAKLKQARDNVVLAEAAVLEARAQVLRNSVK